MVVKLLSEIDPFSIQHLYPTSLSTHHRYTPSPPTHSTHLPSHPSTLTLTTHPPILSHISPILSTHSTPFQVLERYYAGNTLVDGPLGIATGDIHAKKGVGPAARATLIKSIRRQNSSSGERVSKLIALDRRRDVESNRLIDGGIIDRI